MIGWLCPARAEHSCKSTHEGTTLENEANNNDATVKMDPVDHDPGRTQVLPEDACPTQEPDPFAPREPLGATGPMPAVEEASSQDE